MVVSILGVATVALAAVEWEVPADSPVVMHAAGLDRELDGDIGGALALLRAALALAPEEPMIAFDLARVALENDSAELDADVAAFLAGTPQTDDARVLRVYILARLGQRQAARAQLDALASAGGEAGEALRLRDLVARDAAGLAPRLFSGSLRLGLEGDSNVTVIPDAPQRLEGLRVATQAALNLVPLAAPTELSLQALLRYAPHLNDRAALGRFDVGSAALTARLRRPLGGATLTLQLAGNEVTIDSFQEQFMMDLFGDAELRFAPSRLELALFARGGWRDFAAFNPEADAEDRDGARYSLGGLVESTARRWSWGARASVEAATAQGKRQREVGSEVGAFVRWSSFPFQARLAVNHALRRFPQSERDGAARLDNRVTSSVGFNWMLHEHLGVFAAVVWVKNLSNQDYGYDRLLAQLGVMTPW